jgi:site-specific DNA recombinase
MNNTITKVRLYARVSTQEQAVEGVSIEAQLAHPKAYAVSQNWQITGEDVDGGYSGGSDDRPGLRHLLIGARKGEFNIIAVAKLDRFFRNLRLLLNYLHEFEQLGIKFVSTQEMLDTSTPYGKFAVQIMGVIAEFERGRIGERIRDSRQYRKAQGKWTSGRTPYGYRWLPKEQQWEIIEEEAKVVRYIYHLYLDEKMGTEHIHTRLNEEGLRNREGSPWYFSSVLFILSNPAYKGTHRLGLEMPVIIDTATWDKVEQQRHKTRSVRGKTRNWLLQGMCVCGICGHTLKCVKSKGTKARYYVCRGRLKKYQPDGKAKCNLPWMHADQLEVMVWNKVKQAFADPNTLKEYVDKALDELEKKRGYIGEGFIGIEKDIAGVKKKQERLGIAYADGTLDESIYKAKLHQLRKQEAEFVQRQHNLDPSELMEVNELSHRISAVRDLLQKGTVHLTDLGFFASAGDQYVPLGFNPWPESHGKMAVGEMAEMQTVLVDEESGLIGKSNVPPGFTDTEIPTAEKGQRILTNWRELLRFLNIKVTIYPDHTDIRGAIPPQIFETPMQTNATGCPITNSVDESEGILIHPHLNPLPSRERKEKK